MKHILVAYDASEQADKAFDFAMDLADKFESNLTVLAVTPSVSITGETEMGDVLKASSDYYNNSFIQLKRKAEQHYPAIQIDFKIADGSPAQEIIHNAEKLGIDHIVMGHRGLTKFKRWLLGSVAKQVMLYAHCAITIIR